MDRRTQQTLLSYVSRETLTRLEAYVVLLIKWNKKMSLISKRSEVEIWQRHVLDSMQLYPLLEGVRGNIVDLGSGGGFPGLVLAIMGVKNLSLVESDQRKCAFLRHVARQTNTEVNVIGARIETLQQPKAEVIMARGFAALTTIFEISREMCRPETQFILLKGEKLHDEVMEAEKKWTFSQEILHSKSDTSGSILIVRGSPSEK
jgi:16S rRNA (guanine527-N7)-methyltransferase